MFQSAQSHNPLDEALPSLRHLCFFRFLPPNYYRCLDCTCIQIEIGTVRATSGVASLQLFTTGKNIGDENGVLGRSAEKVGIVVCLEVCWMDGSNGNILQLCGSWNRSFALSGQVLFDMV